MRHLLAFFLILPFSCFAQSNTTFVQPGNDKSGIVNMDTIQKYHPFTIQFKKDYLELTGKYTKTLKAYKYAIDSFVNAHPKINTVPFTSTEWQKFQSLQQRLANFETMAHKRLEEYQRGQTAKFLDIFKQQLASFIAYKKLLFIIDKSLLLHCQPCNDYSKEILDWIKDTELKR